MRVINRDLRRGTCSDAGGRKQFIPRTTMTKCAIGSCHLLSSVLKLPSVTSANFQARFGLRGAGQNERIRETVPHRPQEALSVDVLQKEKVGSRGSQEERQAGLQSLELRWGRLGFPRNKG